MRDRDKRFDRMQLHEQCAAFSPGLEAAAEHSCLLRCRRLCIKPSTAIEAWKASDWRLSNCQLLQQLLQLILICICPAGPVASFPSLKCICL